MAKAKTLFVFSAMVVSLVQTVQGMQEHQMHLSEEGADKRFSVGINLYHSLVSQCNYGC